MREKKAAPCRAVLHHLLSAAVHPGGLGSRWGCGFGWVLLSAGHVNLEGLGGT